MQCHSERKCYWTGVYPDCRDTCQTGDYVALDLGRPLDDRVCQNIGRLRYCCFGRHHNSQKPNDDWE